MMYIIDTNKKGGESGAVSESVNTIYQVVDLSLLKFIYGR
jgi:hypothetical protein